MPKYIILTFLITLSISIIISCSKDGGSGQSAVDCNIVTNKAFASNVNPIIQGSCNLSGCHAPGSSNGPGALTNYTQVFNARTAIRSAVASGRMPQSGSLSTVQKNSITCWIDSGAPNN